MAETLFGEVLVDADASNTRVFHRHTFNKDVVLDTVRCRFEYFNNPNFTSLNMKIYSLNPSTNNPVTLLHTSDSRLASDIESDVDNLATEAYGDFETYFKFSPQPLLSGSVEYGFIINGVWSSFSNSSHLRWLHPYPDFPHGGSVTTKEVSNRAYWFLPFTADQ